MSKHRVCPVDEIPLGQKKIVKIEGKSIGVFNVNNEFYAVRNICPHQGAPLCVGNVGGMTVCKVNKIGVLNELSVIKKGEILRCPWHGWEFDIKTGHSIFDPEDCYVKTYDVQVVDNPEQQDHKLETYDVTVQSNYILLHM